MELKAWFLLKGFTLTPWFMFLAALGLTISAVWERGKKARTTVAIILLFLGTVILIVMVLPYNYKVMYNIGGL